MIKMIIKEKSLKGIQHSSSIFFFSFYLHVSGKMFCLKKKKQNKTPKYFLFAKRKSKKNGNSSKLILRILKPERMMPRMTRQTVWV